MRAKRIRVGRPRFAMARFFLAFFAVVVAATAWAASPSDDVRFGPEFTFWVHVDYPEKLAAKEASIKRMMNHLIAGQQLGAQFEYSNDRFTSPNGWTYLIKIDQGVLEVTMGPMTAEEFELYKADIQDAIFTSIANEGFFPALFGGGGHINIDGHYFKRRPLLLHNFIVDLLNHNELFLGIFGYDTNNAMPFDFATPAVKQSLATALELLPHCTSPECVNDVFLPKWRGTFSDNNPLCSDPYWGFWHNHQRITPDYTRCEKYFAFSLTKLGYGGTDARIELRGVRPQASMDVWVRQIRLLRKRIAYLETLTTPLTLKPRVNTAHITVLRDLTQDEALVPPVDAQEALRSFYAYVTESGEKWSDHRDYIWPQWITNGERDRFEESLRCEGLLGTPSETTSPDMTPPEATP